MRVLITGISGFLGRQLAPKLVEDGHEVSGIRLDEGTALPGVVERQIDILNTSALNAAVSEFSPDVVVHLAGLSHVGKSWDQMASYFAVNVLGVENVLRAAPEARMIFASSSEVYGSVPAEEQPILESRTPAPRNPYGLTKAASERLVLAAGGVVMRTFNLIGPGQERIFALPSFAEQLANCGAEDSTVIQVGNLEARRDFVHVADGADAYAKLVEHGEPGGVYNLGSGRSTSIREALDQLIVISGRTVSIEVDPERLRPNDMPLLCADASKLEGTGWRPKRGLTRALEDLWQAVSEERTG